MTTQIETSKIVTYTVLDQIDARASKLVTYAVLDQIDARVSKLATYLVLDPVVASSGQFFMGQII
jgi:hypothetical protein